MPSIAFSKKKRALKLWEKQSGICWICGYPMLPPLFESVHRPGSWTVSIDHLTERNGKPRPVKGAHMKCNSIRQHKNVSDITDHLKLVTARFQNEGWIKSVFGKEVFDKLTNPMRIP